MSRKIGLVPIVFLIAVLYAFGYIQLAFESIKCRISGDRVVRQGMMGRYCRIIYDDVGKRCYSNKDCKSNKCALDRELTTLEQLSILTKQKNLSEEIYGECSETNQDPCFTGEILIHDSRTLYISPVCD